jgi:chitodextrinase
MKSIRILSTIILLTASHQVAAQGFTIDHSCTDIHRIPASAIQQARDTLHIAYGHTSHGSQLITGMTGLIPFMNAKGDDAFPDNAFTFNNGGTGGALDLRDTPFSGANDLGAPNRTAWATATRNYLAAHPEVNVIIWSWCGQVDGSESDINTYLNLMSHLETDYPNVKFVYMTGHLNGTGAAGNVNVRNNQIRAYCAANNKILYDFADIESYDPDGAVNYMELLANDNCDYDSDNNGSLDRNWATAWQNTHTQNVDWFDCYPAHSQALNGNLKAYAAWWLWARLAGWNGAARPIPDTRDGIFVWADQLTFHNSQQYEFVANHFVGSQKLTANHIQALRAHNPDFLVTQYHKAYGVDIGNNITGPNTWSNDIDEMRRFIADHPEYGTEESYYMHWTSNNDADHRVQHYWEGQIEFHLADISHAGFRAYVAEETMRRCREIGFDGAFYDVAYFPWYDYEPDYNTGRGFGGDGTMWYAYEPRNWPGPGATLAANWNALAVPYWQHIANAYHANGNNYLCIPNCDRMVTGWYEDVFMDYVDGGMMEGFMSDGGEAQGRLCGADWLLSASRTLRFLTGNDKILIAQPSTSTDLLRRKWQIANFLLLKNQKSFFYYAGDMEVAWYPEYGIDLGAYAAAPTQDLDDLLVDGTSSLYAREYENGLVLVNPGDTAQSITLNGTYYRYAFSGGGLFLTSMPAMSLTRELPVSGTISVPAHEAMILWQDNTPATDTTAPSVPADLQAETVSSSSISLSWTASTDDVGVTGYRIMRDGVSIGTSTTTSYVDTHLAAGTTYAYAVAAFDAASNMSENCATVSATTLATDTATEAAYARAVPAIDAAIKANLRNIKARGDALGRVPGRIGQWGDSITDSWAYLSVTGTEGIQVKPTSGHDYDPVLLWMGASQTSGGAVGGGDRSNPLWTHKGGSYCNQSGWRISNGLAAIAGAIDLGQPSWSLTMFGSNDIRSSWNATAYELRLRRFLQISIDEGVVPVISTIPPCVGWDAGVAEVNAIITTVAADMGVPLVDLHGLYTELHPTDWAGTVISSDGVHPSSTHGGTDFSDEALRDDGYVVRTVLTLRMAEKIRACIFDNGPVDGADLPILVVASPTHPYNALTCDPAPMFTFTHDGGATPTGYSYLLDQQPRTVPDTIAEGTQASASFTGQAAGTWYFHVRANSAAGWGPAVHYPIRIVSQPVTELRFVNEATSGTGFKDTYVSPMWGGNDNFGGGSGLNIYNPETLYYSRGMFAFDLSAFTQPFAKAELVLHLDLPATVNIPFRIHTNQGTWIEGTGTWANDDNSGVTQATAPPMSETPVVEGTVAAGSSELRVDITALVNDWVSGAQPNHGIAITHGVRWNSLSILTRENGDRARRPALWLYTLTEDDTTAPTVPANLAGSAPTPNTISLTWTASSDIGSGVTGYRVRRDGALAGTSTTTSFGDSGLTAATTYSYTVAAFDAAGNESAPCEAVSITTPAAELPADTTAPTVPTGLSGTALSSSRVQLSWSASSDPDPGTQQVSSVAGYRIRRDDEVAGTSTTTSFIENGLAAATTYAYTVAAFDATGNESTPCDAVSVTTSAAPTTPVDSLQARHYAGQTILTWREIESVRAVTPESMTMTEVRNLRTSQEGVTYRVYRSSSPITSVAGLTPVRTIGVLSGWNTEFYGQENTASQTNASFRYVVDADVERVPAARVSKDTAVCAYNPPVAGTAYYAVTVVEDGVENTNIGAENMIQVAESTGQGVPLLQSVEVRQNWYYTTGTSTHYFYTRWEAPPNSNVHGRAIDYQVVIPAKYVSTQPMPAIISFHGWAGNMHGMSWWFNFDAGTIVISSNQEPYDWWTGYHEELGVSSRSQANWSDGVVRPYTQNRINSFYDWVATQWNVDRSRTIISGVSMGGSGAIMYGIRHPDRAAWVNSWVGVHVPAESPTFLSSYQNSYGDLAWGLLYEDNVTPAFSYFDDDWYLRHHVADETPFITFSNGRNDGDIGWGQAVKFARAMQDTRRPFIFYWGVSGHGQRTLCPPDLDGDRLQAVNPIDIRTDQSLPAFTRCSLDGNLGNGDPADGDEIGQMNAYLYWETSDNVDESDRWAMTVGVVPGAPAASCTVDVTPRQLQHFAVAPGQEFNWTNTSLATGEIVQSGRVVADAYGLVTLESVAVNAISRSGGGNRIVIEAIAPINYATWKNRFSWSNPGVDDLPQADPDGDGVSNFSEYALNGHPLQPGSSGTAELRTQQGTVEFVYDRRITNGNGLTYRIETCTDLIEADWTEEDVTEIATDPLNDDFERVTCQINPAGASEKFIRLIVE